ncbi:MAG TPA: hypothetical protein VEH48_00745 [Candidatus Nitrosopolaris sp.]|nr:hypothetical protein [Candidatus Nitrosopolaris sp.]
MAGFEAKSLCILGRQPALGLAELESLYGPEHIQPLSGTALLDLEAGDINFKRLGGCIKVAKVLASLPGAGWNDIKKYLLENVPKHLAHAPAGKFTLGLSFYGLAPPVTEINKLALDIKRASGRPLRVVPNKSATLNSAQVLHNKLTSKGAWELLLVKNGQRTILAQTFFVQDIEAYGARDQARPKRDARVGMLPPKLAQIIINLAAGPLDHEIENKTKIRVLDPFCGTGVVLQEALLMGYSVLGSDIEPRLVGYSEENLKWLVARQPKIEGNVALEAADATSATWPRFTTVGSEVYLGRPLAKLPEPAKLKEIISDVDTIIKKFLKNLAPQLKSGRPVCLALPAWRQPNGQLIKLPIIDQLTDMGYNYMDLKHVGRQDLVYFREDQVVARQLIRIARK